MTTGLGISIGTVNVVSARVDAERPRPAVRIRRTAVGFDSTGTARLGGITRFPTAVNEFADLGRDPESVFVDGRIWSPANIFASVVAGLLTGVEPEVGVVATHPAGYTDKQVMLLRQALDLTGVGRVRLVPEPVAAVQWLEQENGPLDPGFVLVYDLGGNSLDVTIVRTGPDWPDHPMVGKPLRSYDFGGRPLGAMIARCAGDRPLGAPAAKPGGLSLLSIVDTESLRRDQIRDSLELVRAAVRSAGITMSDINRLLLVGGAARPPQVASTLAELGLPVTVSADPGQRTAVGAALLAARDAASASGGRPQRAPLFSGAALLSAVAMSAATVLGGSAGDADPPPAYGYPDPGSGTLLYEIHGRAMVERTPSGGWSVQYGPHGSGSTEVVPAGMAHPLLDPSRVDSGSAQRTAPRGMRHGHQPAPYADPSRFANPLPFIRPAPHVLHPPAGASHTSPTAPSPGSPDSVPSSEQPASGPLPRPGVVLGGGFGASDEDSTESPSWPIGVPTVPGITDGVLPGGPSKSDAVSGSDTETSSSNGVSGAAAANGTATPAGTGAGRQSPSGTHVGKQLPGGPVDGISPDTSSGVVAPGEHFSPGGRGAARAGDTGRGGRPSPGEVRSAPSGPGAEPAGSIGGRNRAGASSSSDHGPSHPAAKPGKSGKARVSPGSHGGSARGGRGGR